MISIRPWTLADAAFVISVRNRPDLMEWFRQSKPILLSEQKIYMLSHPDYHGYIILEDGEPVGVIANHKEELCIAAPFKYHALALPLLENEEKPKRLYGDVLYGNPMLQTYLDSGFKIKSIRIEKCL